MFNFQVNPYLIVFFRIASQIQLRECSVYKDEYKDCKSFKGRFHQYFIYGDSLDCNQWAEDYNNCQRYSWVKDKDAAEKVIKSELIRRQHRFAAHYANDTWTKRENPPADWNKPLPDFMMERNKDSILAARAEELKREEEALLKQRLNPTLKESEPKNSFCTFM